MRIALRFVVLAALVAGAGSYVYLQTRPQPLVLTGVVTTQAVTVSPQITARVSELRVAEGDVVTAGQLVAVLAQDELREERAFYSATADGVTSQVRENEAALRLQEMQTADQIKQAEATLQATESQRAAAEAELRNAQTVAERSDRLLQQGVSSVEQRDAARTALDVARSRLASLEKQIDAQRSALGVARANAQQVAVRRSQLQTTQQQAVAAAAQRERADVRLAYTEIRSPIAGVVDVRAVREGEVVAAGAPLLTLINPDDLWIRADVEETYVDRLRIGDTLRVRLPSGDERDGTIFFRAVDAGFATQRDVSRTKRDIKTFEIRLRVDNRDRRLAVGMTAYVQMPAL
jgi:HlyD family secretion protein